MPKPRYILLFDFDGTINFCSALQKPTMVHNPETDFLYRDAQAPAISSLQLLAWYNQHYKDVFIPMYRDFQLVFTILQRNEVLCLIGSGRLSEACIPPSSSTKQALERLQMQEAMKIAMYQALDSVFGPQRTYLTRAGGEQIKEYCKQHSLGVPVKCGFLQAAQQIYGIPSSNIILVDDAKDLQEAVVQAGFLFVHANEELQHLPEVLFRCIPLTQIVAEVTLDVAFINRYREVIYRALAAFFGYREVELLWRVVQQPPGFMPVARETLPQYVMRLSKAQLWPDSSEVTTLMHLLGSSQDILELDRARVTVEAPKM